MWFLGYIFYLIPTKSVTACTSTMPSKMKTIGEILSLAPEKLSQDSFSPFGTVIQNPAPRLIPSVKIRSTDIPANAVQANQGSALKYLDVTHMKNLYGTAPSKVESKAVMNMFVCAPRKLLPNQNSGSSAAQEYFAVEILERHPFTPQTFIPLALSASASEQTRYLVIVAPSLPPSPADETLPAPAPPSTEFLPGRGLPDLKRIQAFIADGSQAVTYGAGTWHAPMVVVGIKAIDFVVVQFANGVGIEDCQEVLLDSSKGGKIMVAVPKVNLQQRIGASRL